MPSHPNHDKILAALQHDEPVVREYAAEFFAYPAPGEDNAWLMPEIIKAVEHFGQEHAWRLMQAAGPLPHSADTVAWMAQELEADLDTTDPRLDNYRCTLITALLDAPGSLLLPHTDTLRQHLPEETPLRPVLELALSTVGEGWNALWDRLVAYNHHLIEEDRYNRFDQAGENVILRAMTRCVKHDKDQVLSVVRGEEVDHDLTLTAWLTPAMIRLAGFMKLEAAIPKMIQHVKANRGEHLSNESSLALQRINSDEVVQAINRCWWKADQMFKFALTEPLARIHTPMAFERAMAYLNRPDDETYGIAHSGLGRAALAQLYEDAIPVVYHQTVGMDGTNLHPDDRDVWYDLVVVATILEAGFPEYDTCWRQAKANNFGRGHEDWRMSEFWNKA